jgi:anti-sigma-K factor RskA
MSTPADFHLDTGAMALGALPDDELAQVQEHLETCESCAAELAGFRETVAMLAAVSAEAPPASLRRSIMEQIAVTPQLPPLLPAPSTTEAATPTQVDSPPAEAAADLPDNVVPIRRWFRRPGALIAAAVAAVVIGGGAIVAVNQAGGPGTQVAQTPEECIAQAADKKEVTPAAGGEGSVTYAASCSAVLLDVTGLPDLPDNQTYQLWALKGDVARSLDVLPDASAGQPQLVTKTTEPGENAVAITVEPAGGSAQPTLPIVWQASLT